MKKVSLHILDRSINLQCDPKIHRNITAVAERLNARLNTLQSELNASNVETLIIMSIRLLDELEKVQAQHEILSKNQETLGDPIQNLEKIICDIEQTLEHTTKT